MWQLASLQNKASDIGRNIWALIIPKYKKAGTRPAFLLILV